MQSVNDNIFRKPMAKEELCIYEDALVLFSAHSYHCFAAHG